MSPQLTDLNEQLQALSFEKEKQEETIQQLQRLILVVTSKEQTQQRLDQLQLDYTHVKNESEAKREFYEHQAELFINAAAIRLANELQVNQACPVCGSKEHPNPRRSEEKILTKQELEQERAQVEALESKSHHINQELTALQMKKSQEDESIAQFIEWFEATFITRRSDGSFKDLRLEQFT